MTNTVLRVSEIDGCVDESGLKSLVLTIDRLTPNDTLIVDQPCKIALHSSIKMIDSLQVNAYCEISAGDSECNDIYEYHRDFLINNITANSSLKISNYKHLTISSSNTTITGSITIEETVISLITGIGVNSSLDGYAVGALFVKINNPVWSELKGTLSTRVRSLEYPKVEEIDETHIHLPYVANVEFMSLRVLNQKITIPKHTSCYLGCREITENGSINGDGGEVFFSKLEKLDHSHKLGSHNIACWKDGIIIDGYDFSYNPKINLYNPKFIQKNVEFRNTGSVYIGMKWLNDNSYSFNFKNFTDVTLSLCKYGSIHANCSFHNGGDVTFSNVNKFENTIVLENSGGVYPVADFDQEVMCRGKIYRVKYVDGILMAISGKSRKVSIANVTPVQRLPSSRIPWKGYCVDIQNATNNEICDFYNRPRCKLEIYNPHHYMSHSTSISDAFQEIEGRLFWNAEGEGEIGNLVEEILNTKVVTRNHFKRITGACEEGLQMGMTLAGLNPNEKELPLDTVLERVHGFYGETFKQYFVD